MFDDAAFLVLRQARAPSQNHMSLIGVLPIPVAECPFCPGATYGNIPKIHIKTISKKDYIGKFSIAFNQLWTFFG
ncbi:hypothetical protein [Leisingera aquimarina]|uniref:hypothetical protein n=1 Tax=Leisingera aquimarina TaxID=476529 RepID=UPI00146F9707|nr:hypothetical protein [Leisingera aquimarina]